ncbi:hypothetical protein [Parapedobacter indicus]|uniref:Uncharacterized protein n=1 Tax=Parapedobacter indicus TaxID=1477437 RepID=A0A1I3M6M7_9SPHI|nr:hypothetical protein [Parapedobacter indicus]PPL01264.1 hypothetical protein CLV26_10673 [Parapedobacter indicus]SFI92587.1 hypothetical protein SAMN05444682_106262 [Parapedobacter indicus]
MTFMENWIVILAYIGGIVTVVVFVGCIYLLKIVLIELHTTCDDDYEWHH